MPSVSLNVPHFKQEFPYSCIAACVRMVLAFHGQNHSESALRTLLNTGPHGTRARDITAVAALGFDVDLVTANTSQLRDALVAGLPPIVFLETGSLSYWQIDCSHVVVVVGMDDSTIDLADPFFDTAPQRVALTEFLQAWSLNAHFAAILRPRP